MLRDGKDRHTVESPTRSVHTELAVRKFAIAHKQYSFVIAYAGGNDFKISEAYTRGSIRGQDRGRPVGVREHGAKKEKP